MGFGSLIGKAFSFGMKNAPKIGKAFGSIAEGSKKFGQIVEGGRKFGSVIDSVSGNKGSKFYKDADALAEKAGQISNLVGQNAGKAEQSIQKIGKALCLVKIQQQKGLYNFFIII